MQSVPQSKRLSLLPPYLFDEIDRLKAEAEKKGIDVIDFGIGDPDRPTPTYIIDELCQQAYKPSNHRYPSYRGLPEFREAVASYYRRKGVIDLSQDKEIIGLIGSKEGIAHLPFAIIDDGDIVLIPDPGYPVYQSSTLFAGGTPYFMPLRKANCFLPDFDEIPDDVREKAKLMFLNYPNNPTSACATKEFFESSVLFAEQNNIIICHDASYLEMTFDDYQAPSLMETTAAKNVGIEIMSLSKTFNMTGWRVAAAVGNEKVLDGLLKIKMNTDSGVFNPIQFAAIKALRQNGKPDGETMTAYSERRRLLTDCLNKLGWSYLQSDATFYLWVHVPDGCSSIEFSKRLLTEQGLVVTPGVGFGPHGEGFIRFSLTLSTSDVQEGIKRLSER